MSSTVIPSIQSILQYLLDRPTTNDNFTDPLIVLGNKYQPSSPLKHDPLEQQSYFSGLNTFLDDIGLNLASSQQNNGGQTANVCQEDIPWPSDFISDVATRLWFTYRSGFPVIKRDPDGPSPLSLGSLFRGTLDVKNASIGFTTDSGWGCMIRTSQSLLANALLNLHVGRKWRYIPAENPNGETEYAKKYEKQWQIITWFADFPWAPFSIQQIVRYGSEHCNKKPGEWFGPSAASRSIVYLCKQSYKACKLNTYLTEGNGDIYEDELLSVSCPEGTENGFRPTLILSGVRLGVRNVNPVYWAFLKKLLSIHQSVGIAGGRPSSSHYFFGYQGDDLFYMDPHTPQTALLADHVDDADYRAEYVASVHTKRIRKLGLCEMDPSMLIGLLVTSLEDYKELKRTIAGFKDAERFLNIYEHHPVVASRGSAGSELFDDDDFIDLGVEQKKKAELADGESTNESSLVANSDTFDELREHGSTDKLQRKIPERRFSQAVLIEHADAERDEINFDGDATMISHKETEEKFEEVKKGGEVCDMTEKA